MNRNHRTGLVVLIAGLALGGLVISFEAKGQRAKDEPAWEYKVETFSYNPGERLADDRRAAAFAKILNDEAKQGWEPVGSVLIRDNVQTIGGGVTTRDTLSFVAFRRPKR
jgi:hypothetical protein